MSLHNLDIRAYAPDGESQGGYRPPLLETKVVQVYPSPEKEEEAIKLHEKCGWMLVSSNRQQERHGTTTSTFIRITFQRDRNMPNYAKVKELSDVATSFIGTKPKSKDNSSTGLLLCIIGFVILSSSIFQFVAGLVVGGLISLVIGGVLFGFGLKIILTAKRLNKKYKDDYYAAKSKAERAADECEKLIQSGR